MCKIIFFFLMISIFSAEANFQTLGASFSYERVNPSPFENAYGIAPSQKFSLSYTLDEIEKYWGLSVSISKIRRDFSKTIIKDKKGVEKAVSEIYPESENEASASIGTFFSKSPFSFALSFGSTISKTPFSFRRLNFSGQYSFNDLNSTLGFGLEKLFLESPINYFTNQVNFKKMSYPTKQLKEQAIFFWENIWNERLKTKLSFSYFRENELIRSSRGTSFSVGYSLTERLFTLVKLNQTSSVRDKVPFDNNGFFHFNSLSSQVSYDLNFEWTVFGNYTLMREIRENSEISQQANDEYIFGFKHIWTEKNLSQSWQISHIRGNLKENSISLQGKIEWNII